MPICLLDQVIQSCVTYSTASRNNPVNKRQSVSSSGKVMSKSLFRKLGGKNPGLPFPVAGAVGVCGTLSSLYSFVTLQLLLTWESVFFIPVKIKHNLLLGAKQIFNFILKHP